MMTSSIQVPSAAYLTERGERSSHAGPSPLKRGEIGFVECSHDAANQTEHDNLQLPSLRARHPADRDSVEEEGTPQRAPSSTPTKSTYLNKTVQSFQLTTCMSLSIQILVLGGTIVLWVHAAKLAKANHAPQNSAASSASFVHAVFVMAVIVQLILLQRRLVRLRAERHCHLHLDEVSRHRRSPSSPESIISSAPWNRPPLPTYAAALALTGAGTGDVEDHLIAVLPPPAYGNIRGSTLLYSGDSPFVQPFSESSADRSSSEFR